MDASSLCNRPPAELCCFEAWRKSQDREVLRCWLINSCKRPLEDFGCWGGFEGGGGSVSWMVARGAGGSDIVSSGMGEGVTSSSSSSREKTFWEARMVSSSRTSVNRSSQLPTVSPVSAIDSLLSRSFASERSIFFHDSIGTNSSRFNSQ